MCNIRLLIVDSQPAFLQGIRLVLEQDLDIDVLGTATNVPDTLEAIQQLRPAVVLIDPYALACIQGDAAIAAVLASRAHMAVIVFTAERDPERIRSAGLGGVSGYIIKEAAVSDIVRVVKIVAAGGSVLDPLLATTLLTEFRRVGQRPNTRCAAALSERDHAILRLIAQGRTNREIGVQLHLAEKTARNAVHTILQKLDCADRTQAAVYALQHGLISYPFNANGSRSHDPE